MKIIKSLQNNSDLVVIDMDGISINNEVASEIAVVLSNNAKLRTLSLRNTNLETDSMIKQLRTRRIQN